MKKVIYISALVLGLVFVSCQKQDVAPTAQEMDAPAWQDDANFGESARGITGQSEGTGSTTTSDDGDGKGTVNEDGEITDPNLDPDAD